MLYFVPAWYKENSWIENEQQWYRRRMKSEFDETIKQITLFHRNVDVKYRIVLLGYSPNFRHFAHRQGMYRSPYWSCFDAIAQVKRTKMAVLSYHDIKWPEGVEFVYSPFSIVALYDGQKYAQVEFGEDGNPIIIDMYEGGQICRRNYYDDRGFVSSTIIYENGQMKYQEYLMENTIWKLRVNASDGSVMVNPSYPMYDTKTGEKQFCKLSYGSLDEVIQEVMSGFVNETGTKDTFFVAAHSLHMNVLGKVLRGRKVVYTFFEERYDYSKINGIKSYLKASEYIITDSEHNLSDENLSIMDIPPYDTRMDFGISQQLKVQNILIPIDGLDAAVYRAIIRKVSEYLCINDLAMVHIFTRNAQWGHEDNIRKELAGILKEYGYDTGWVSKADNIDENEKRIKQRFFIDVCVDERTISKCINEQRVILDLRGVVDVFLYITAISKGVPRISFSEDQFLHDGQNGIIIDDHDQIGTSLAFYLDSLENWNAALVACYEAGKNYKTEVLLDKWRKVLGIVE